VASHDAPFAGVGTLLQSISNLTTTTTGTFTVEERARRSSA
jgi:hypothetical protein